MFLYCPASRRYLALIAWLGCIIFLTQPTFAETSPRGELPVLTEVVARIGTKCISNRDVEARMELVMLKLDAFKKKRMAEGTWDVAAQTEYDNLYYPAFRSELCELIKEQLLLQEFTDSGYELDRRECDQRIREALTNLRADRSIPEAQRGTLETQVRKDITEHMKIDEVRARLLNAYATPNNRDVRQYYERHPEEFRHKPGEKIRRVRLLRFYKDYLGMDRTNPDALEQMELLRSQATPENIADLAREHSQDEAALAKQGGLLGDPAHSFFIETELLPTDLKLALRGLKPGEFSSIYKPDERSWVFVFWEAHRESGILPLDEPLMARIRKKLAEIQREKAERLWLQKVLKTKPVTDARDRAITLEYLMGETPQGAH